MNNTISVSYTLKWQHKIYNYYKWTSCGKLFNTKTGKLIKKTTNGGSIGYWIKNKFIILSNLKNEIEKIPKDKCPF